MANLFDYVHWRGDLSFNKSKFNDIDNVILSQICYVNFSKNISKFPSTETKLLKNSIEDVFSLVKKEEMVLGLIVPQSIVELTDKIKDKKRFNNIEVSNYIDNVSKKKIMQFSAMCFHLSNNLIYIAFRGTDDSIVGWQENLDMVANCPVPSQLKAKDYVNKIAALFPDASFILGGHSKGGNLASYAAIYCHDDIKDRIVKVYNNDGPGFLKEKIDLTKYELVKEKMCRVIPFCSIVGLMLDPFFGKSVIVNSHVRGLRQHDAFTWEVDVKKFEEVDDIHPNAKKLDEAITAMIYKLSAEERKDLADNVFTFVEELNKDTLIEVQKDSIRFVRCLNKINSKNRKIFLEFMYNIIKHKQL